jgi:hypothetical protein
MKLRLIMDDLKARNGSLSATSNPAGLSKGLSRPLHFCDAKRQRFSTRNLRFY